MIELTAWLDMLHRHPVDKGNMPAYARCGLMLCRLGIKKFCPIVTVGGTNGKGTTTHLLADYFKRIGKKVGRFTSPHLLNFNERIVVNGLPASDAEILAAFTKIEAAAADLQLSYFDYAFLAALYIFKEAGLDCLVLEVGIGGRLDAVNTLSADLAVITTIDFDHTEILGDSREAIGFEKAGIFRSSQLSVCGDRRPPSSLIALAKDKGSNLHLCGRDFDLEEGPAAWSAWTSLSRVQDLPYPNIPLQNALTALMAAQLWGQLASCPFDVEAFRTALQSVSVPGRMQVIQQHPEVILDVAHNPHAVGYLKQYLKQHPAMGKTFAVFSGLQEKDLAGMIAPLRSLVHTWFLFQLDHPRAALISDIVPLLGKARSFCFDSMEMLQALLFKKTQPSDRVVVFGSFVLVSSFLECHNATIQKEGYL